MQYKIVDNEIIFKNVEDFDLEQTFQCGQSFRWDKYAKGFKGFACNELCYIFYQGSDLHIKLFCSTDIKSFAENIYHYLALDVDYKHLKSLFSQDDTMKKAIAYAEGIRVLNQDFFEMLITFIISQNNNIPRIKKIVDAMAQTYGSCVAGEYAFPTAQQLASVSIEDYNLLKMGFRSKYVFDAVQKVLSGEISQDIIKSLGYEDAQKYLMKIKGVGPKVADCVLLFGCERYESFPKDVWINRAMGVMFPDGLPCVCKGYEGIAQQYIFHYARFNLEKE